MIIPRWGRLHNMLQQHAHIEGIPYVADVEQLPL